MCLRRRKTAEKEKKKIRLTNFLLFINVKKKGGGSYYLLDKSHFVNVPESLPCAQNKKKLEKTLNLKEFQQFLCC